MEHRDELFGPPVGGVYRIESPGERAGETLIPAREVIRVKLIDGQ